MLNRRELLFNKVRDYIFEELRKKGVTMSTDTNIPVPDLTKFDIFSLLSEYKLAGSSGQTIKNIKEGIPEKLETMERFFSLQTAVNYCSFLMSCAYAENSFTFIIPSVGSEMRVESITRAEGFRFRIINTDSENKISSHSIR
jgi:hypothetical protein